MTRDGRALILCCIPGKARRSTNHVIQTLNSPDWTVHTVVLLRIEIARIWSKLCDLAQYLWMN